MKNSVTEAPNIENVTITLTDDRTLEITPESSQTLESIFSIFAKLNIQIVSMRNKSNRLEELFMNLVKK